MKTKLTGTLAIVAGMMLTTGAGLAAEASVSADLASAYVFRGATLNNGAVLQPGLEVGGFPFMEGFGNLALGVWGNLDLDDYDGAVKDGQFSEIDLYANYALPIDAVNLSIGYTEYTYPSGAADADREVSLSAGLGVLLSPSLSAYYGVGGAIRQNLYVEASLGHDFELAEKLTLSLGATIGYLNPDEGADGFSHYTGTVGLSYAMLRASVTYVGRIDDEVLPNGAGAYDTKVYGTVGLAYAF